MKKINKINKKAERRFRPHQQQGKFNKNRNQRHVEQSVGEKAHKNGPPAAEPTNKMKNEGAAKPIKNNNWKKHQQAKPQLQNHHQKPGAMSIVEEEKEEEGQRLANVVAGGSHSLPTSFATQKQQQPLIGHEAGTKWFDYQFDETRSAADKTGSKPDAPLLLQAQTKAEELLKRDIELFVQWYRSRNRGDADWLETVSQRGTFADRLSALQLRVQRSPVHALPQLRQFVALVQRKAEKIRQSHSITKALKELFLDELLPPHRKLLQFSQRPIEKYADAAKREAQQHLILWQFESELKQCYRQFVEGLQALAGNMVEGVAHAACRELAELLAARPEQEQLLLGALVNKLGHPLHRVGAGVAECLERQVTHRHPNMRPVVVAEMESLIFRKNISPKAQRYALHFLSRMLLDAGEAELALQLIRIYLRLFRILVVKDALAEHPKLLPLLITGLNRAFPYAKGRTAEVLDDVESLYAIVQTAKFSTALSVLRLLFQIHSTSDGLSDRFYSAFYRRLLNVQPGSQHDSQLFMLAQQILKHDLVELRVCAFLKRFFQLALSANSAFAAATLLMCHAVVRERPQLLRLEGIDASELAAKQNRSLSVTATKKVDKKEVKEESKDKGSDESRHQKQKAQKLNSSKVPSGQRLRPQKITWFEENDGGDEEEEEEHYEDVQDEEDEGNSGGRDEKDEKNVLNLKTTRQKHGWIHRGMQQPGTSHDKELIRKRQNGHIVSSSVPKKEEGTCNFKGITASLAGRHNCYDPYARNPLFAGAEWALDTELCALSRHYHPTVASFAHALIKGQPINYRGDPLVDLSQMRFLDRFAFKNPKTRHKQQSAASPSGPLFASTYQPSGVKALNPTSQDYLSKRTSEIPLDERFLHHFATLKFKGKKKEEKMKKTKKEEDNEKDEVASLDSDEFDMLMERFEPGENREVFDVDFGTEFGEEADSRAKRKALKRRRMTTESDDEENEDDEEGLAGSNFDDDEDADEADEGEVGDDEQDEEEDDEQSPDSDVDVRDFDSEAEDEDEEEELEFD